MSSIFPTNENAPRLGGASVTGPAGDVTGNVESILLDDYALPVDVVQATIGGQIEAAEFLKDLEIHYVDPDRLFHLLGQLNSSDSDAAQLALRGFCRAIQKRLENTAGG
jgi:hypothetical protein